MAQKPKTFRDSKGNIRQIGTSKIVKRAAVNPLDAAVNSAIGAQVQPYTAMDKSRLAQYNKDVADTNAVQETLQQRLAGIQSGLQSANADALGLAAQRGTASADQMQRNMDFLRQTLGNYTSDQGAIAGGVQPASVASGSDAAGNAVGVGLAAGASGNQLAAQRGASVLAGGERSAQLLNARKQDQLAIQREIARIRSQAPLLKRQFGRENAEMSLARQELGLSKQQLSEQKRQFDASQDYQYDALDAGTKADKIKNETKKSDYGYGIPASLDEKISTIFSQVAEPKVPVLDPATGQPTGATGDNDKRRWRTVISQLRGLGVKGGPAVLLATKWMPERLNIHGSKSPQVIYKILKSGELGFKASDAVAKQVFKQAGLDWSKRTAKGGGSSAVDTSLLPPGAVQPPALRPNPSTPTGGILG